MNDREPGVRNSDIGRAYTELARITRRASIRARGSESFLSVVDQSLVDFVVQHPGAWRSTSPGTSG